MTVKEITGVRELTAQECVEINGGGGLGTLFRVVWKYGKKAYKEFSNWCVVEYFTLLFS